MTDEEYQAGLDQLQREWGGVHVDPRDGPGYVRANLDPMTGVLVGHRAPLIAEIINRALTIREVRMVRGERIRGEVS